MVQSSEPGLQFTLNAWTQRTLRGVRCQAMLYWGNIIKGNPVFAASPFKAAAA